MVNLDPVNDSVSFSEGAKGKLMIDVRDLITMKDAMEEYKLGHNGAMLYCIEFLLAN